MTKKNIQVNSMLIPTNNSTIHELTLNVDFGNVKGNPKVIFFDTTCVISSSNGIPHILIASTEFNPQKLPDSLKSVFFDIPNVNLILSFDPKKNRTSEKYLIPIWVDNMRKLAHLRIEDANLSELEFLQKKPIKNLILNNVKMENRDSIIQNIVKLKDLKYLVHSLIFTPKEVDFIKTKLPKLNVLLQEEYNRKVERGELGYEN